MRFVGANRAPRVAAHGRLAGASNYLRGRDPARWITGVPNFSEVVYSDLYDGVDLAFHASRAGELEFDYTLAPGVDPDAIRLAYSGAGALRLDESGALVLRAGGGEVRQAPPIVYQMRDGVRRRVRASYELHGGNEVGFALEDYDRRAALLIDPVLTYSTYLGGSADERPIWSDIDGSGNFYVTGVTSSPDFPTTSGGYQPKYRGNDDVFVTKLNPAGSGLVWSTYIGGDSFDVAIGLDVDRAGNVVVTGETGSTDYPTTEGAYQRDRRGKPTHSSQSSTAQARACCSPRCSAARRRRRASSRSSTRTATSTSRGRPARRTIRQRAGPSRPPMAAAPSTAS
jgi:Beta-propeller repeat